MYILLYVKLILCSGISYIYDQGGPLYMYILLYVKLILCSGISYIYDQLERVHLPSVYVHSAICITHSV